MKSPRLSISSLMAVVLIVALDFGVGRALVTPGRFSIMLSEVLLIAVLPMANILAIAIALLVVGRREPGPSRSPLVGFVTFGMGAWLVLLACSLLATQMTHDSVNGAIRVLGLRPGLALVSFIATLFLLPQVGVAAVGWWVGRQRGKRS